MQLIFLVEEAAIFLWSTTFLLLVDEPTKNKIVSYHTGGRTKIGGRKSFAIADIWSQFPRSQSVFILFRNEVLVSSV